MDCQKYAIKSNIFKQTLEVCEKNQGGKIETKNMFENWSFANKSYSLIKKLSNLQITPESMIQKYKV